MRLYIALLSYEIVPMILEKVGHSLAAWLCNLNCTLALHNYGTFVWHTIIYINLKFLFTILTLLFTFSFKSIYKVSNNYYSSNIRNSNNNNIHSIFKISINQQEFANSSVIKKHSIFSSYIVCQHSI